MGNNPLLLALGFAVAALGVQTVRRARAEAHVRRLALEKVNLQADADSTRIFNARAGAAIAAMGLAHARGVERLVRQEKQKQDELDEALGRERVFTGQLQLKLADLVNAIEQGAGVRETAEGVREDSTTFVRPLYTAAVHAALPPAPAPGTFRLGLTFKPFDVDLRLGCGPANEDGVRPATAAAIADTAVTLRWGRLSQSEEVCQSPVLASRHGLRLPWWVSVGTFLLGVLTPSW